MNSIRESIHKIIDSVFNIIDTINNQDVKPVEKENVTTEIVKHNDSVTTSENTFLDKKEKCIKNSSKRRRVPITEEMKKRIIKEAKKLYKLHKNDKTYGICDQISDIANHLGYPIISVDSFYKLLGKYAVPGKPRAKNLPKSIHDKVGCLASLGFNADTISVALGISKHTIQNYIRKNKQYDFTIKQKEEVFLEYKKYLSNIALLTNISLPFDYSTKNLRVHKTPRDIITEEAKRLVAIKQYATRYQLMCDVARNTKCIVSIGVYDRAVSSLHVSYTHVKDASERLRQKYAKRLLSLGIPWTYASIASGHKYQGYSLKFPKYTIEELREAYNYNPDYIDGVAKRFGIDISMLQTDTQKQVADDRKEETISNEIDKPKEDPTADIPIEQHIRYLRKFGHMRLSDLAHDFNLTVKQVKDIINIGVSKFKFTKDEIFRLRAKYQVA